MIINKWLAIVAVVAAVAEVRGADECPNSILQCNGTSECFNTFGPLQTECAFEYLHAQILDSDDGAGVARNDVTLFQDYYWTVKAKYDNLINENDELNHEVRTLTLEYVCPNPKVENLAEDLDDIRDIADRCLNVTDRIGTLLPADFGPQDCNCSDDDREIEILSNYTEIIIYVEHYVVHIIIIVIADGNPVEPSKVTNTIEAVNNLTASIQLATELHEELINCTSEFNATVSEIYYLLDYALIEFPLICDLLAVIQNTLIDNNRNLSRTHHYLEHLDIIAEYEIAILQCDPSCPGECNDERITDLLTSAHNNTRDFEAYAPNVTAAALRLHECLKRDSALIQNVTDLAAFETSCEGQGGINCSVDGMCYLPFIGEETTYMNALFACVYRNTIIMRDHTNHTIAVLQQCFPSFNITGTYLLNSPNFAFDECRTITVHPNNTIWYEVLSCVAEPTEPPFKFICFSTFSS